MAPELAIDPTYSVDRPRVLVVDDEYGPREAIAFTLGTEFSVDTADRAMVALEKISKQSYSAVILDIRMPEMDGIKALAKIRELDRDVAVLMLTGYGTLATAQQALLAGANQYIRKPPDIDELLEAVRNQSAGTAVRRQKTISNASTKAMLLRLKQEMTGMAPDVWQGKASVELVHDLANPLTVLICYASLLSDEAAEGDQVDQRQSSKLAEYATIVKKAAEYCHQLAEDWRHASRQAADYIEIDLVKLVEEVKQVVFFNSAAINTAGLHEAKVRGSKTDLTRVLQNLLRNSFEANAGSIALDFTKLDEGGIRLTVTDDGDGMSEETTRQVLLGGFSTKAEGTGLGLRICRHLLGAHGAKLSIESMQGMGTTISVSFPELK
jgi:signal transduction histidine kinase